MQIVMSHDIELKVDNDLLRIIFIEWSFEQVIIKFNILNTNVFLHLYIEN